MPAEQLSLCQLHGGFVPAVSSAASCQLSSTAASCLLWLGGFVPAVQHGGFVPAVARRLRAS